MWNCICSDRDLCRLGYKDFYEDSSDGDCEEEESSSSIESGQEDENDDENKAEDLDNIENKAEDLDNVENEAEDLDNIDNGVEEVHLDEEAALMSAMGLPTAFAAKDTHSKVF